MRWSYSLVLFAACLLVACKGEDPQDSNPVAGASGHVAIEPVAVVELDPVLREMASWTAKACELVTGEGSGMAVDADQVAIFEGFFIDPFDSPAGTFDIVLKGADSRILAIPATTGASRPDVADFFKVRALERSGFRVSASLKDVPPGRYAVDFMLERAGQHYFCESGKQLVVQ